MKQQMFRFALSGTAGYIVDSVVLYGVMALGMGFLRGRLVSFTCAVVATFLLNRHYTFADQLNAAHSRQPLWHEFARYVAAMAVGGLLNLATYWLVLEVIPHTPAIYALAVAAGSLVGMVINFASAKWWVFIHRAERQTAPGEASPFTAPDMHPAESDGTSLRGMNLTTARCIMLVQAVFWASHLTEMALPGLYMDAANPEYVAAHLLNPAPLNVTATVPTIGPPLIGSLYHGVQNLYVGLPVFALLGFNMLALRVAQGLFASGILVMTQLVLQRAGCSLSLALAGALGLATELAFIASFRTQMYIVMSGTFWLLLALYLALGRERASATIPAANTSQRALAEIPMKPWFLSGLCAGLAVYSYFVFLFFIPVFLICGGWHTRSWRALAIWSTGFVAGMQTYVLGYALMIAALGGLAPALEWVRSTSEGLGVMSSELSFTQRVANAWAVMVTTLQNIGNELMIFATAAPAAWTLWKVRLLAVVPPVLIALGIGHRLRRERAESETGARGLLASWHIAWLPVAFIAVSLIFGDRLWSHHFSPLVPLSYLILFLAVHQLMLKVSLPRWLGMALMAGIIIGNVHQQQMFFSRLEATGGVKYFSNAMNRMAEDALSMPDDVIYMLPEWGFMMPFALLTGNSRTYDLDVGEVNLQRLSREGTTVRVYFWEPETEASYRDALLAQGFAISAGGAYLQRDQQPAFYWLEGVGAGAQ